MQYQQLLIILLLLSGCRVQDNPDDPDDPESEAAIDIELVQDPNINSTQQLLAQIDTIVLIVDSDQGLYEPGEETSNEVFEIRDADNEPSDLELVSVIRLENGAFPPIRLEQGGLPDEPINIRVLGGLEDRVERSPIAEGSVDGVTFQEEISAIDIPFNIRPAQLPPRVISVIPGDGDIAHFCELMKIVILFSKPMDADTFAPEGAIEIRPMGTIESIESIAESRVIELQVSNFQLDGQETLTYELVISPQVSDLDGVSLDQHPAQDGNQGYQDEITLDCRDILYSPIPLELQCRPDNLEGLCEHGQYMSCIEGQCTLDYCDVVGCPAGYSCSVFSGCQVDCRLYGDLSVCPDERPVCSPETGLCGE